MVTASVVPPTTLASGTDIIQPLDGKVGDFEGPQDLIDLLLSSAADGIAVFRAEKLHTANDIFAHLLGFSDKAALLAEYSGPLPDLVALADRAQAVSLAAELLSGRLDQVADEISLLGRDKCLVPLNLKMQAVEFRGERCILVIVANDAHLEREALQNKLGISEGRLNTLIDMIPYGITWTDLNGVVRISNPAYNHILGYEPGELTGSKVRDVLVEEQMSPQREFNEQLLHEFPSPLPNITQCKTKDGRIVDVLFHWIYEKDENGKIKGFISVMTDVTETLKNETKLRDSKEIAERANREKSRFLAAASHDLQQPLHSLAILLGLLERPSSIEKRQEIVHTMSRALDGSMALLRSVLDISKLEAGVISPRLENFDLESCFDQIEAELGPQLVGRPVKFRLVRTSIVVRSDRMLLKSITHNLVSNAIRYTSAGKILVGCRRRGNKVRIEIWDTGRGVPVEKQAEIFQEFKRLEGPEGQKDVYALGLGLSIVDRTCQLLGYKIELKSTPGKGSVFYFDVPRTDEVKKTGTVQPTIVSSMQGQANLINGKKILLIEDNFQTLAHTGMLLESWGCDCMAVESLFQAMGEVALQTPDLILTDYNLSADMTGVIAADKIRETCGKDIPVVIITSDVSPKVLAETEARGYSVLEKPVSPGRLRALLTHYFQPE